MRCLLLIPTNLEVRHLFKDLTELSQLGDSRPCRLGSQVVNVALCGFGLAQAGAAASRALATYDSGTSPDLVILSGLAGTLDTATLAVGSIVTASSVHVTQLGIPDPQASGGYRPDLPDEFQTGDQTIQVPSALQGLPECGFLSVTTPSDNPEQARQRRADFPECRVEEMEAYSVAVACQLGGVPLACVRVISNVAGNRDRGTWEIEDGLARLKQTLVDLSETLALEPGEPT